MGNVWVFRVMWSRRRGDSRIQVAAPVLLEITEINSEAITVEWAPPENELKLSIKETIKQESSGWTWSTTSERLVIKSDKLVPDEAHMLSAVFLSPTESNKYNCLESPAVCIIPDLEAPLQHLPNKYQMTRSLDLFKSERSAKILLFGGFCSGTSSLCNAFLTLFQSDDNRFIATKQLTNYSLEMKTKRLACIEIPGTKVSIWDSASWEERGDTRIVSDDYNPDFLQKLISGHFGPGYELFPPFSRDSHFYTETPSPDARFNVVVLTFSCEHIAYHPLENRVLCRQAAETNLIRMYRNLQRCEYGLFVTFF
eukprot:c8293_g1_i3.p1 GENE.c8293_g1_i3~~c8293_g1_i3.p1  ORF type:complete len:311 (-),score=28.48 c8293_g1_i3:338-1270(-)